MKSINQRLNNINGQIDGVKKMIESKKDCVQILTQLKSIKSAVNRVMEVLVDEKFDSCMKSLKNEDKKVLVNLKKYLKD